MTQRGTGLLVVILAGLATYLWLVEVRRRPETSATEPPPLLAAPAGSVARVELVEGETRITAVRRDGGWVDPGGHAWPDGTISDLVETLGTLRPVMVVDPHPEEPSDYGLGDGAASLRVTDAAGQPLLALQVGERNPAWTGLYARLGGRQEVVLVGAVLRWELAKLRGASPGQ